MTNEYKHIGHGRKLIDGLEKITGQVQYTADFQTARLLHAKVILSPYAHALITSVDKTAAQELPGVVAVFTADELPTAKNTITSRNSAVLAVGRVQWVGQPVAIVVAESEAIAADAAELVWIEYEPLPAVISLDEAIQHGTPQVWPNGMPKEGDDMSSLHARVDAGKETTGDKPNNMIGEVHFERGNVAEGFAESDVVIERTYRTSMVHQAYLEPHAVAAVPDPFGQSLTLYTSVQGLYGVRDEVAKLVGLPRSGVTVKPMAVGGAFGAKYGIYDPLVAAVALALRQPVKLVLTRSEDLLSTTPAPQTVIHLKTGAKKDGTVTAIQATIYVDNGVFGFSHGGIMSLLMGGYYKWAHTKLDAYEIATHKSPVGAYRAPGAPQATFAIESNIDDMARELGFDVLEFRLQNAAEGGDPSGVGRPWAQNIGLKQCLERLKIHPAWANRQPDELLGIAIGGWPTAVGTSETICRVDTDGKVRVNVGIVDISGSKSSLALVAAEAVGVHPDDVIIVQDDSNGAYGPNSGGSMATYSTAGGIHSAGLEVRQQIQQLAADHFEAAAEDIEIVNGQAQVRGVPDRAVGIGQLVEGTRWKRSGPGPISAAGKSAVAENAPAFVAHLIKIKLDEVTGVVTPLEYVAVQDVGFALNPLLVDGQLQGGAIQGVGMALYEGMVYSPEGQLLTGSFMDYGLPRVDNVPKVEVIQVENPSPHGPFGMRGIAEPPITAAPAAIGNAIRHATGARLTELPMRPEVVWRALQ